MTTEYTLEDFIADEIAADPTFAEGLAKAEEEVRLAVELSRLRESRGLTQAALAELIGVKQPQVARIERGQLPTVSTLALLARALGAEFTITATGGVTVKPLKRFKVAGAKPRQRRKKAPSVDQGRKAPLATAAQ